MRPCTACRLSQTRNKMVPGEGPLTSKLLFLGQNPGIAEDKVGRPFVGPSGVELQNLLWKQGIFRNDIRIDNVLQCRGKEDDDMGEEEIAICTSLYLIDTINIVSPRLIVALGAKAFHWLCPDQADLSMELAHGFLYRSSNTSIPETDVLVAYHPAAGLHNPGLLAQGMWDLEHIKPALHGRLPYGPRPADPPPAVVDYQIAQSPEHVRRLLPANGLGVVAIDTESREGGAPWCLTASTRPGMSVMIKAEDGDGLKAFAGHIVGLTPVIHNLLYDYDQLLRMGIHIDPAKCVDTMILAYLLQFLPKGLKPLAYRLAGVRMDSYLEVTQPARFRKAMEYLTLVSLHEWPDPEPVFELKPDGTPKLRKPQNVNKKIKRVFADVAKGACVEPWARWAKMEGTEQVEELIGRMPDGWLCDVDEKDAVAYAGADSDMTLRIYPTLKRLCEERGLA